MKTRDLNDVAEIERFDHSLLDGRHSVKVRGVVTRVIGNELAVVLSPWYYAPADPRRRLLWFAISALVAAAWLSGQVGVDQLLANVRASRFANSLVSQSMVLAGKFATTDIAASR